MSLLLACNVKGCPRCPPCSRLLSRQSACRTPKTLACRVLKMAAGHAFAFSSSESAYVLGAARFLFFFLSQDKLCRVFFLLWCRVPWSRFLLFGKPHQERGSGWGWVGCGGVYMCVSFEKWCRLSHPPFFFARPNTSRTQKPGSFRLLHPSSL